MLTPQEIHRKLIELEQSAYDSLIELLDAWSGFWEQDEDDSEYIVNRASWGSPIIWSLKVEGLMIYFKDALYGSSDKPLVCKSESWNLLWPSVALKIYNDLYKKLSNK